MRNGGEKRGSSADRRARREWIVSPAAGHDGDGSGAPCAYCREYLPKEKIHIDRCMPGGSYRRANIRPACPGCNRARSDRAEWVTPLGAVALADGRIITRKEAR